MNRVNNKGFSMVEVLVAIAIMAIVASAAAFSVVKYVAKTRESTDMQTCSSITTCVYTALATEEIWDELAEWNRQKFMFYIRHDEDNDKIIIDGLDPDADSTKQLKSTLNSLENPKVSGMNSYKVTVDVVDTSPDDAEEDAENRTYAIGDIEVETSNHTFSDDGATPIYPE